MPPTARNFMETRGEKEEEEKKRGKRKRGAKPPSPLFLCLSLVWNSFRGRPTYIFIAWTTSCTRQGRQVCAKCPNMLAPFLILRWDLLIIYQIFLSSTRVEQRRWSIFILRSSGRSTWLQQLAEHQLKLLLQRIATLSLHSLSCQQPLKPHAAASLMSFGPSGTHMLFSQDTCGIRTLFMLDPHILMWDLCGTHILCSGVHLMRH